MEVVDIVPEKKINEFYFFVEIIIILCYLVIEDTASLNKPLTVPLPSRVTSPLTAAVPEY